MSRFCFVLLASLFFQAAVLAGETGERIFYNAKIFTAEPDHPYAEAVAIRGDKIVAVGNRGEVSKAVAASAELVDLKGNFLMPGLIDSHCHAIEGGLTLLSASIDEFATTIDQLASVAADAKKTWSRHARRPSHRQRPSARILVEE